MCEKSVVGWVFHGMTWRKLAATTRWVSTSAISQRSRLNSRVLRGYPTDHFADGAASTRSTRLVRIQIPSAIRPGGSATGVWRGAVTQRAQTLRALGPYHASGDRLAA